MHVTVVIPTRRRPAMLRQTLEDLGRCGDADFDVVVVCDGEDPDTKSLATLFRADFPLQWVFEVENRGQAVARNVGVEAASGDLLLFLDDDSSPLPGWIQTHRAEHSRAGPPRVAVGPVCYVYGKPPGNHTERMVREYFDDGMEETLARIAAGRDDANWRWVGTNTSLLKTVFSDAGGYDPFFRNLVEDIELAERLRRQGIAFVLASKAVVLHRGSKDVVQYYLWGAYHHGRGDAYRLRCHSQHSAYIRSLHRGAVWRRTRERIAWTFPRLSRFAADLFRRCTDFTGLRLFFALWWRLAFSVEYWRAVKDEGVTQAELELLCRRTRLTEPGQL